MFSSGKHVCRPDDWQVAATLIAPADLCGHCFTISKRKGTSEPYRMAISNIPRWGQYSISHC
ncbi:unnamed protein product [Coffea canephora]|uniref:Uncharacterized protein n=1 Tax=Coffea canephora TaxID=49390 RepID=A0A068UBQ1_COFCA|nr:unnamed protein product [Coffea canephora]